MSRPPSPVIHRGFSSSSAATGTVMTVTQTTTYRPTLWYHQRSIRRSSANSRPCYFVFECLHWLGFRQCSQFCLCNKVALTASVCHDLWVCYASPWPTGRPTQRRRYFHFMVLFQYLGAECACISMCLLLGPMFGATLQSSVLAQTRPQLRYGNRRHNLYVALI